MASQFERGGRRVATLLLIENQSIHRMIFLAFTCSIIGPMFNLQALRDEAAQPCRQMLISSRCIEWAYTNLIT